MTFVRPIINTGGFYHVYNKSIADTLIFNKNTLFKILEITDFYRFKQQMKLSKFKLLSYPSQQIYLQSVKKIPLIDIYAFSFMPNHFHFLIKQLQENGIRQFISNFQNSFAKSFNLINNRLGSLFLNSFKLKQINTEEEFIHVVRYIHLNLVTSYIIDFEKLKNYPFTSFPWYLNKKLNRFINTDIIMNHFPVKENFIKFHHDQVDYQRKLRDIKKLLLDG